MSVPSSLSLSGDAQLAEAAGAILLEVRRTSVFDEKALNQADGARLSWTRD